MSNSQSFPHTKPLLLSSNFAYQIGLWQEKFGASKSDNCSDHPLFRLQVDSNTLNRKHALSEMSISNEIFLIKVKVRAVADLRRGAMDAPRGPNSFNFMQFLEKFGKIVCWHPPPGELVPLLGEILDPPLAWLICTQ